MQSGNRQSSSDGDETRLRCGTREVEQPSSVKLSAIRKGLFGRTVSVITGKVYPALQSYQFGFRIRTQNLSVALEVLLIDLSDVVGGNRDIAEALAPREKEGNVPAFNRADKQAN
jgi:hypothetical protein